MNRQVFLFSVIAVFGISFLSDTHAEDQAPLYNRSFESLAHDKGGISNLGISVRAIRVFAQRHSDIALPSDPRRLTEDQRSSMIRSEFFIRPNLPGVLAVPGLLEQAPNLPEQLFDSAGFHGARPAGMLLQQSLDTVLGTDLSVVNHGRKQYDGIVGPNTLAALEDATRRNLLREVNNEMVRRHGRAEFNDSPGWYKRTRNFLMP